MMLRFSLSATSPEPEEEMVKEAALYRHNKQSLDGLKSKKTFKKPRQIKPRVDTSNDSNTGILFEVDETL